MKARGKKAMKLTGKKIFLIVFLITLFSLIAFSFAQTIKVELPVPEKETGGIEIKVNSLGPTSGIISVTQRPLSVELTNIGPEADLFVGINKTAEFTDASTEGKTKITLPLDYVKNDLSQGVLFKVINIDKNPVKQFAINNWDGAKPIKISVCQDKNKDKDCKDENETKQVEVKYSKATLQEIKCTTIKSCLAAIGKRFSSLTFD